MDQQNNRPGSGTGAGFGTGSGFGTGDKSTSGGSGSGTGTSGTGSGSGGTFDRNNDIGLTSGSEVGGFGTSSTGRSTESNYGTSKEDTKSFESVLKDLGIPEQSIVKMRESIENLDIEGYFNQAKDFLKDATFKAKAAVKDNKAIVAGALAVVTIGAGVLLAINKRDKDSD